MINTIEEQLKDVIDEYEDAKANSKYDDASDIISKVGVRDLQTRCLAAIERISGRNSVYYNRAVALDTSRLSVRDHLAGQIGVAKSLLSDVRNNYLSTLEELHHSEVFADFLEMADHLTDRGYKDAAAVLAGSSLETHLRHLCSKHGIAVTANSKPKKAEAMNTDLRNSGAYSLLEQKQVTAWLDLRNNAAHGNYSTYDEKQVKQLISGVRDFIVRYPA